MFNDFYKILSIFKDVKTIRGRKRLQKIIYIMQQLGYDFGCEYTYCHYGPYSPQLQMKIDRMCQYGLINETVHSSTYEYSQTDRGQELCETLEKASLMEHYNIPVDLIKKLINNDVNLLELASTIMYVRQSGYSDEQVFFKVKELKPHLEKYYNEAIYLLDELNDKFYC